MSREVSTVRTVVAANSSVQVQRSTSELIFVHVIYTSSATVGNRQLIIEIADADGDLMLDMHAGAVQAASLVRHYVFQQGVYREGSFVNDEIQIAIPTRNQFPAGWSITIKDDTGVDVADSFIVVVQTDAS